MKKNFFFILTCICGCLVDRSASTGSKKMPSFNEKLLFSTSTAAYQIEGGWNADGKGVNIWDTLCHQNPSLVRNNDTGDVACDSYRLYKEDVELIKNAGFQMYRFSISWSRVFPDGNVTKPNPTGIQYYHNLIDELLKNNVQPMVTMYHWDLPQPLQDIGGWVNPLIADYFEDYVDQLFKIYGAKVKWWITINEPFEIVKGYAWKLYAPALNLDSPANYIVQHNILRAHGRAYRLYDKKYRSIQNGKISITLSSRYYEPKTDSAEDVEAANRAFAFNLGVFSHPIFSKDGDYPKVVREAVDRNSKSEGRNHSRLPYFNKDEIDAIKGSADFFALNHYSTSLCTTGVEPVLTTFGKDMNVSTSYDSKWPSSKVHWLKVVPWGFRKLLIWIKDQYGNPPVFITENGYCDTGTLDDNERVDYYHDYLQEMLNAMENYGCNVIGYTTWSILDNFEWLSGYEFSGVNVGNQETAEVKKETIKAKRKLVLCTHNNSYMRNCSPLLRLVHLCGNRSQRPGWVMYIFKEPRTLRACVWSREQQWGVTGNEKYVSQTTDSDIKSHKRSFWIGPCRLYGSKSKTDSEEIVQLF